MTKLPAFQFYPGDWLKDPALRLCSPQARALWIDLLCLMWETENRGILRTNGVVWTERDIEKTTGIDRKFLQELVQKGVCAKASRSSVFYSKRMVRDEIKRARLARNGQKGGKSGKQMPSKTQANIEANPEQTKKQNIPSSSSSSSSSSDNEKTEAFLAGADAPTPQPEPPPEPPEPIVAWLPTNKAGAEYPVPERIVVEMSAAYPAVDVPMQLQRMRVWLIANPKSRKTASGMLRFMSTWLAGEQDKPKPRSNGTPHAYRNGRSTDPRAQRSVDEYAQQYIDKIRSIEDPDERRAFAGQFGFHEYAEPGT